MDDFISDLRKWCRVLETSNYVPPEEFPAIAVDLGKAMSVATMRRMIDAADQGATKVEILAAFPLALAFLVNNVICCSAIGSNEEFADRIFASARTISRELGDGDPQKLLPSKSPASMN